MKWVYFIVGSGKTKIGTAIDVERRLSHLSDANPFPLRLVALYRYKQGLELALHAEFASRRSHCEWFHGEISEPEATLAVMKCLKNFEQEEEAVNALKASGKTHEEIALELGFTKNDVRRIRARSLGRPTAHVSL